MKPVVPPFLRGGGFGTLGTRFEQPALPASISLWPATTGAYVTLALLAGICGAGLLWLFRRYRRRAPRRVALQELSVLEHASDRSAAVERLLVVLKAVALDSYGRKRVAALSGERWRAFLASTAAGTGFEGAAGESLLRLGERGGKALSAAELAPLFAASRRWVRRHHVGT